MPPSAPNVVNLREFRNRRREQQEHKKRITKDAMIDRVRAIRCYGFACPDCGHRHQGVAYAYICIGCRCERTTPKGLSL